jgi:hypothetical protein
MKLHTLGVLPAGAALIPRVLPPPHGTSSLHVQQAEAQDAAEKAAAEDAAWAANEQSRRQQQEELEAEIARGDGEDPVSNADAHPWDGISEGGSVSVASPTALRQPPPPSARLQEAPLWSAPGLRRTVSRGHGGRREL